MSTATLDSGIFVIYNTFRAYSRIIFYPAVIVRQKVFTVHTEYVDTANLFRRTAEQCFGIILEPCLPVEVGNRFRTGEQIWLSSDLIRTVSCLDAT
jgi:hypothetical protein